MKTTTYSFVLVFFLFSFSSTIFAQNPGDKDLTFVIGSGPNHIVNNIEILPNGHIFLGGDFGAYNNNTHHGFLVVYPNGTPDTAFNAQCLLNSGADVRGATTDPNGNLIIGGFINTVDGVARKNLARLLPSGALDTTFVVGTGANNEVTNISSNGQKVAISGFFSQYNGQARSGFAYLNNTGELDTNFTNPSWSFSIYAQQVLPNNKVIVGGNFSSFHNAPFPRIARLNSDGSVDSTFNTGSGASGPVETIAVLPNGKILIGGSFTSIDGQTANRVARLNANGSLDNTFNAQLGASSTVRKIAVDNNGKIVVAGQFYTFNGISANFIVRLFDDGTVDSTFIIGTGFNGSTHALAIQPDNKILVGGAFTQYQGAASQKVIRLWGDSVPPPVTPVFSQPVYNATCFGDTVVLEISSGNLAATDFWEWRINDCLTAVIDTGWTVKFAPQSDTTTFAVKASNSGSCATVQLIVLDTVAPILSQSLPALTGYCEVNIPPQNAPTAQDFCVGPIVGIAQGPLNYNTPGTYTLPWLFDDGHGNTAVYNQQIDVLGIDTSVTYQTNLTWIVGHSSATAKYQWADCGGGNFTLLPNDTLQTFSPQYSGEFAVIVSEANCIDTSSCHVMNLFSVDEFDAKTALKIYPNPATEKIKLAYPTANGAGTLRIFNANGQLVLEEKISTTNQLEIDIKKLSNGVYTVQVETKNHKLSQRLVKL